MRRICGIAVMLVIAGVALTGYTQTAWEAFPLGTTRMVYRIESNESPEDIERMAVELCITSHGDEHYTLEVSTRQTGTVNQLGAEAIGLILGATSVSLGDADDVDYSPLMALIAQRDKLREGQNYMLPNGTEFTEIMGVTIAGVFCLEGSYLDPTDSTRRMAVAFALSHPTFVAPRLREQELQNGEWMTTFLLELTDYSFTELEG